MGAQWLRGLLKEEIMGKTYARTYARIAKPPLEIRPPTQSISLPIFLSIDIAPLSLCVLSLGSVQTAATARASVHVPDR
jgi:hypothetical protein